MSPLISLRFPYLGLSILVEPGLRVLQDSFVPVPMKPLEPILSLESPNDFGLGLFIQVLVVGCKGWEGQGWDERGIRVLLLCADNIHKRVLINIECDTPVPVVSYRDANLINSILQTALCGLPTFELDSLGSRVSKMLLFLLWASMSTQMTLQEEPLSPNKLHPLMASSAAFAIPMELKH